MGFKRRLIEVTFKSGPWTGLEVFMRPGSMDQVLRIDQLIAGWDPDDAPKEEVRERALGLLGMFDELLVDWNLEDQHGNRVPPGPGVGATEDFDMVQAIMHRWYTLKVQVPDPLPDGSDSTGPPDITSIPMEMSSPDDRQSSPAPN